MSYLDFLAIKEANHIEPTAEKLGLTLKRQGNQLRGPCPSGQGGDRALVITPEKEAWYSFGLGKGGDVISLVALVHKCSPKEAAAWLSGDTQPEKKPSKAQTTTAGKPSEGFQPLEYLVSDHEAVIAIGLQPDDAARLGAGFAPRGVLRGTVAIPVRDEHGKLLGYVGCVDVRLPSTWRF